MTYLALGFILCNFLGFVGCFDYVGMLEVEGEHGVCWLEFEDEF